MRSAFVILLVFCGACSEQKREKEWVNVCPDLTWLDTIKNTVVQNGWKGEIYLSTYKGQRVFEINMCLNCADFISTVNNCEGEVLCQFGGIAGINTCPDFAADVKDRLLYWKN